MNGDGLSAPQKVVLEEACRIANRLDVLDDFLDGRRDSWMKFHARNEDGSIVEVVLDKALGEARQQALALKQLIAEMRAAGAVKQAPPSGKVAGVTDLSTWTPARSAKASG